MLLILRRSPPTVSWLVVSKAVDAINRGSFWTLTHVCKKVLKRRSPSIANGNSATSVARIFRVFLAITPAKHGPIGNVGRAFSGICGMSVLRAVCLRATTNAAILSATRCGLTWCVSKLEFSPTGHADSGFSRLWFRHGHILTQTRGGGRVLPGLVARRAAEAALL